MDTPLRLLFVTDPAAAQRAVEPVRRQVAVEASVAPAPSILAAALRDAALRGAPWSAVLYAPGGPISAADVARVMAGQTVPLVVIGAGVGRVPAAFAGLRAIALDEAGLEALPFVLQSLAAEASAAAADAFVGVANATFAARARATAALPEALAAAASPQTRPRATPSTSAPSASAEQTSAPARRPEMSAEAESLAEHLPVGMYRTTPAGRIAYANPALADVLGVASTEGLDIGRDIGYPREAFAEEMRRTGAVRNLIVRWTTPRGDAVVTRENARAVVDAAGEVVFYEGVIEDVTADAAAQDADRARARHHEAVARFAAAADGAATPGALYLAAVHSLHDALGADWALVAQHDAGAGGNRVVAWAGRFTDESAQTLTSDAAFARLPVVPQPVLLRDVESSRLAWLPDSIATLMRAHGMRSLGCFPLHRAGQPLGALIVGFDAPHTFAAGERQVGEVIAWHLAGHLARHRAEHGLRGSEASRHDSETSLQFIAEHSAQVLYRLRYDPTGPARFDYLSSAVEALTGYTGDELSALGGIAALVEAREVFAGDGLFRGPVAGEAHYHAVYRIRTRAGAERSVENHAYPWRAADGAAVGLVGALQDVTERTRREAVLADAAQQALGRQSALVELARVDAAGEVFVRAAELACKTSSADGASVWLVDGPWMACRALYMPAAGASDKGSDAGGLVAPTYPADAFEAALDVLDGQRSLAVDDAAADARVDTAGLRPLAEALSLHSFVASPVRCGAAVIGMVVAHRTDAEAPAWTDAETEFVGALADAVALAVERDERAQAERALRVSEARYRVLSDLTSDYAFAVRTDASGTFEIEWATDSFARTSGYMPDEVAGAGGFRALVHPDSWADVDAALASLAERGAVRLEMRIVTREGAVRWLEHSARLGEAEPDGSVLVYHSGRDVSERKQAEADLVAAREQAEASRERAEEMARLKSAFLANMSHEIRTPLTGILGYAELLAGEVDGEQRDSVEAIAQSGVRLLDTLNSVLDLARLESEGVRPRLAPVDVAAEVRASVRLLEPLATRRGLSLAVEAPCADRGAPAVAALDAACLGRIVTNLAGNALKFTETGGVTVSVAVEGEGDHARVAVRVADTGIGIAEAFLPHLFDEFRQETDGPGRSHEGSGLGLSITRRLADLMGGRIDVESRRPGGSVFTVSFPALAPDPAVPAPTPDRLLEAPAVASSEAPVAHVSGDGLAAAPETLDLLLATLPEASGTGFALPASSALSAFAAPVAPVFFPDSAPTSMFNFRFPSSPPPPADEAPAPDATPLDEPVSPYAPPPGWSPVAGAPEPEGPAGKDAATAATSPALDPARQDPPVMLVRPTREAPPEDPPALPSDGADPRPPLLVVEDNLDTRMLLERILRVSYDVTAVGDARSALAAMAQRRFRGFVLDINLGGKETGTDVLRVARTIEGYADVYAVALTAYALPGDRDRLLESGFDEYISKPFTRQSLLDALAEGIGA